MRLRIPCPRTTTTQTDACPQPSTGRSQRKGRQLRPSCFVAEVSALAQKAVLYSSSAAFVGYPVRYFWAFGSPILILTTCGGIRWVGVMGKWLNVFCSEIWGRKGVRYDVQFLHRLSSLKAPFVVRSGLGCARRRRTTERGCKPRDFISNNFILTILPLSRRMTPRDVFLWSMHERPPCTMCRNVIIML